jgi:RNA polymerase sigma-70 factor, ECF subfamily
VPSGSGPHPHRDPWRLLARALQLDAHRPFGLHRIPHRVRSEELQVGNIIIPRMTRIDCDNLREARRKVKSMITIQQDKSQLPFNVLPELSSTAHFNPPDRRATSADEASGLNEDVLISAAQAGHEWAFVELCFRQSKRILFILYKITNNREDAEDALQESVLNAFVHFADFNRASSFATWFKRIGFNSALMILRRKRARPEVSTDAPVDDSVKPFQWEIADQRPNPEDHCIELEKHHRLQSAISKLPKGYRHVVEGRQRSDASIKEIAEEAGITVAATKSRLLRARRVLRGSILE